MTSTSAPTVDTRTLAVPGAVLTYDVRGDLATATPDAPALLIVGSPMGADGFVTLAGLMSDRPVVTYDPRGVGRSTREDPGAVVDPAVHAADLALLIDALDVGPVDVFASSGGAVNALVHVASHPDQVRVLVAHEPPAATVLPDRDDALAAVEAIAATYQGSGAGAGLAGFMALVMEQGPITAEYLARPAPDPAAFGLPTEDDGSRDDALLGQNLITCTHQALDLDAVAAASTRVVLAVGAISGEQLAARAGRVVAERLGTTAVEFPSGHNGFQGDEFGMPGEPEQFAVTLHRVLDGAAA